MIDLIHNPVYLATVLPGLEILASDEISAKLPESAIVDVTRGKVMFQSNLALDHICQVRSTDNLYQVIDRFSIGPHKVHLQDLRKKMSTLPLDSPVRMVHALSDSEVTFVVNASRKGKQTYSRFEAAAAAMDGIADGHPRWKQASAEDHRVEFRLDIEDDQALFSLRITSPDFRFRGPARAFTKAALRPTVAHAMVWCSNPEVTDVFLDPFCGSGTIVTERTHYAAQRITGSDVSAEALRIAEQNLAYPGKAAFHQWDARRLPLDSKSVNKLVTNLPFGRQILPNQDLQPLYKEVIREMSRVMAPLATAIVLTEHESMLQTCADTSDLLCEKVATLSLKGIVTTLFRLRPATG